MTRQHVSLFAIACLAALGGFSPAHAASNHTWVAGDGNNAGTCTFAAPCKTFAYALTQTNTNGTIHVRSSGSFGPMVITKGINVIAPDGVEALIESGNGCNTGVAAICVQAGAEAVTLRGLTITPGNAFGIRYLSGSSLLIQNCVIRRATEGIWAFLTGSDQLSVTNCSIANTSSHGIEVVRANPGTGKVSFNRVQVEGSNHNGIYLRATLNGAKIRATLQDSFVGGSTLNGLAANSGNTGETTTVMVKNSTFSNNTQAGIASNGPGTTIYLGNSTVTGNALGLTSANTGAIASYENNTVDGNVNDGTPTTSAGPK